MDNTKPLYQWIAADLSRLSAPNLTVARNAEDSLQAIENDFLPHGGGFDAGCTILTDSKPGTIKIEVDFHHMNQNGFYDGWTKHVVTVKPSFTGINVTVSGRNRNDIKNYIAETIHHALTQDIVGIWCPYEKIMTYKAV